MRRIVRIIIYALLAFCVYSLIMELRGLPGARNKKVANETIGIGPVKQ
ncbi:MAG: hypothetical protein JW919_05955 [Candidatus Omnitrophica bacterium]|nr:hypothetical protein [Candidatus Omnitrophota bacterium]